MGRQWLHAKRAIVNLKKGQTVGKIVKEITVATKLGGRPGRQCPAVRRPGKGAEGKRHARRHRRAAIAKGSGAGGDRSSLEHVVFEGYAPHKVPVIVEIYTDNHQRTAPEMRVLFKSGHLGGAGATSFSSSTSACGRGAPRGRGHDLEAAAIEAGANDFEASPICRTTTSRRPRRRPVLTDRTQVMPFHVAEGARLGGRDERARSHRENLSRAG